MVALTGCNVAETIPTWSKLPKDMALQMNQWALTISNTPPPTVETDKIKRIFASFSVLMSDYRNLFFSSLSSVLTRMHQVPQFKHASLHRATNKRKKESYPPQPFWALPLPYSVISPHWLVLLMKLYFSPLLFPSSPTWKYLFYQRGQIFNYVQNLFFSKTLVGDMRSIISEKKTETAWSMPLSSKTYA